MVSASLPLPGSVRHPSRPARPSRPLQRFEGVGRGIEGGPPANRPMLEPTQSIRDAACKGLLLAGAGNEDVELSHPVAPEFQASVAGGLPTSTQRPAAPWRAIRYHRTSCVRPSSGLPVSHRERQTANAPSSARRLDRVVRAIEEVYGTPVAWGGGGARRVAHRSDHDGLRERAGRMPARQPLQMTTDASRQMDGIASQRPLACPRGALPCSAARTTLPIAGKPRLLFIVG